MTGPPSWNQTAAALMTDSAKMKRPTPSRRCSGSRSRAPWPIPRAIAPMPWATASQTAATPRKTVSKNRAIGPLPVRTARGAGRRLRLAAPCCPAAARGRLPRRLLLLARRGSALLPGTPCSRRRGPLRRSGPASRTRRGRRTGRHVNTLGNRHTSHRDHRSACRIERAAPARRLPASGARPRCRAPFRCQPEPDDLHPSPEPPEVLIQQGFTRGGPVLRVRSGKSGASGVTSLSTAASPTRRKFFFSEANSREIPQARPLPCATRGGAFRSPDQLANQAAAIPSSAATAAPDQGLKQDIRSTASGTVKFSTRAATGEVGFARVSSGGDLLPGVAGDSRAAGGARPTSTSPTTAGAFGAGEGQLQRAQVAVRRSRRLDASYTQSYRGRARLRRAAAGPRRLRRRPHRGQRLRGPRPRPVGRPGRDARPGPAARAVPRCQGRPARARRSLRHDAASRPPTPELVVYRTGVTKGVAGKAVLAYVVEVTNAPTCATSSSSTPRPARWSTATQ